MPISKEKIKSVCSRQTKDLVIKGTEFRVQTMSVSEAESYIESGDIGFLFQKSLIDENGDLLFGEEEIEDLRNLATCYSLQLRLELQRINGLAEEPEDTIKNSGGTQSQDGG